MKKLGWILLSLVFVYWSCEKSTTECCVYPQQFPEFIFGTYYGECIGEECVETYKIANSTLYEDEKDQYQKTAPYEGEWVERSNVEYQKVKDLYTALPSQLFDEDETTIGMPDAGDWGGIYLEVQDEMGTRFYWQIDTMKDNIPDYLHSFVDEIMAAVQDLKD
jgi:hypothetical protein